MDDSVNGKALPAAQKEYRALEVFDHPPVNCIAVLVANESFEPHLHIGEFCVVDTADKIPTYGELYAVRSQGQRDDTPQIVQVAKGFAGNKSGLWFRFGFPIAGKLTYMDGPLRPEHWPQNCLGRVIGVISGESRQAITGLRD